MNNNLQKYAREQIKQGLIQLPESHRLMFKRMYSHKNPDLPINDVVDNMPVEKLDWAMKQVTNSLNKVQNEN